jgi:hypothetical protein
MSPGLWLLVVGLTSAVLSAAWLLGHLERVGAFLVAGWRRVRPRRATSTTVPVEQLAADLRRLADHLEATYDTDQPAKMQRVAAAALAYDWVLLSACRTLEVPEPPMPPLDAVDRLTTEADLARRGLAW